jgi:hypothetical protein
MTTTIETLPCYQNKRTGKAAETRNFRTPENVLEMKLHCSANRHIWIRTQYGDARQAKVNGQVRTWKRDPNRIEVPCKYGLYEYFTLTQRNLGEVLIPCA